MNLKKISTPSDLLAMEQEGSYQLLRDLDCGNAKITKISSCFKGILDGAGHTVRNLVLTVDDVWSDAQPVALFYKLRRATVKNIKFENLKIEVPNSVYSFEVAALCVSAADSLIENVEVEATTNLKEKLPLIYSSNNCGYSNVRISSNMIVNKFN